MEYQPSRLGWQQRCMCPAGGMQIDNNKVAVNSQRAPSMPAAGSYPSKAPCCSSLRAPAPSGQARDGLTQIVINRIVDHSAAWHL
jgi:hypothetical protein